MCGGKAVFFVGKECFIAVGSSSGFIYYSFIRI